MADNRHPAKKAPSRWFWDDHSDESFEYQVLDLLHDIRLILWFIGLIVLVIA